MLCRFNDKHLTQNHTCGKCERKGHGQRECGNFMKQFELLKTIENDTPHKLHMIPVGTQYNGKSIYTPSSILLNARGYRSLLKPGEYDIGSLGMGCCSYARHNGKIIEYLYLSDGEPQIIEDSPKIKQFIKDYVKCIHKPIYRKPEPFAGLLD